MSLHNERLARFVREDLYVVITEAFCGGRSGLEVLEACLDAGVGLVQFREKDLSDKELFRRAKAFRARCTKAGALMIVDDRLDVALAVGADGVHLGQEDLPLTVARKIAPDLIIGASTHSLEEAQEAAAAGVSYINIGPIFATQTKNVPTGAVGLDMIAAIRSQVKLPSTCMGGIKAENAHEVIAAGAERIAVVTAVTAAPNIPAAVTALKLAIRAGRGLPN